MWVWIVAAYSLQNDIIDTCLAASECYVTMGASSERPYCTVFGVNACGICGKQELATPKVAAVFSRTCGNLELASATAKLILQIIQHDSIFL